LCHATRATVRSVQRSGQTVLQIFTMLPKKHLNCDRDTAQFHFCARSNRTATWESCYVGLRIPCAPSVPHKDEIYFDEAGQKPAHTSGG
jgi:hypothetical protein